MPSPLAISVIIPVLNEAEGINDIIEHLRSMDDTIEIIVVDGDPARSTVSLIRDPYVRTAVSVPGRASQMNQGAALASGDILQFLHADTRLPAGAFGSIRACLAEDAIVGGAFDLGIGSPRRVFRITERYAALRSRLTRVPFGDQAIFVRTKHFRLIGGYASIPIMEDVDLMTRIRRRHDRICIIPQRVTTSARRWEKEGVLRATLRNLTLQTLYCCGVHPRQLARFYR